MAWIRYLRRLAVLLLAALAGCSSATTATSSSSGKKSPRVKNDRARVHASMLRGDFATLWRELLRRDEPLEPALHRGLAAHQAEHSDPELLRALYGAAGVRLRFLDTDTLTPTDLTPPLRRTLEGASDHALDPGRYPVTALAELEASLVTPDPRLTPPAPPAARELNGTPASPATWLRRLVTPGSSSPRLVKAYAAARAARRGRLDAAVQLELLCTDTLGRWARDLSRGNTRPAELEIKLKTDPRFIVDRSDPPPGETPKQARAAAETRAIASLPPLLRRLAQQDSSARSKGASLESGAERERQNREGFVRERLRAEIFAIRDRGGLAAYLASLPPRTPQYGRLQAALQRYRGIVAAGGWKLAIGPAVRLRPGRRHRLVPALRRRLAAEGYLAPAQQDGDSFDAALRGAIRDYQETHQLVPTGLPDGQLWRSLVIPAQRRLRAIELTLERWRESAIGDEPGIFLLVNIPDFHVEIWNGNQRLRRIRIVVGKARGEKCSEETERKVLAYATPTQSAAIKTLVFSPYWNVTRFIKETELDPERGKDALFYEKHGYEVMFPGTAREWVRELPGPANSLGFVKFLFPNPHDTYLHDTPQKALFERPTRAYSHGCMRVEEPWELARLLLEADGQWDEAKLRTLHRRWKRMDFAPLRKEWDEQQYEALRRRARDLELLVTLRRPVPIHVEYYTVRIDDAGRTNFLADVYRLDEQRINPRRERVCIPESKLARRQFSAVLRRLEALEQRSRQEIEPRVRAALVAARGVGPNVTARGLAPQGRWEVKRLLRRLKTLEQYDEHHRSLAARIREEQQLLAELLGARASWKQRQVKRAVRLERLVTGLETMAHDALGLCAQVERLTRPPAGP